MYPVHQAIQDFGCNWFNLELRNMSEENDNIGAALSVVTVF